MFKCLLVGMPDAGMDHIKLTGKHGIKIALAFSCSVEDFSLAVGRVGGHSVEKANVVVKNGIVVNDTFMSRHTSEKSDCQMFPHSLEMKY